jgi:hypothetical protein
LGCHTPRGDDGRSLVVTGRRAVVWQSSGVNIKSEIEQNSMKSFTGLGLVVVDVDGHRLVPEEFLGPKSP